MKRDCSHKYNGESHFTRHGSNRKSNSGEKQTQSRRKYHAKMAYEEEKVSMKQTQVYLLFFIMKAYSDVINGLLIVVLVHT